MLVAQPKTLDRQLSPTLSQLLILPTQSIRKSVYSVASETSRSLQVEFFSLVISAASSPAALFCSSHLPPRCPWACRAYALPQCLCLGCPSAATFLPQIAMASLLITSRSSLQWLPSEPYSDPFVCVPCSLGTQVPLILPLPAIRDSPPTVPHT